MKDFDHFDYNKKASSRGRKQKNIIKRRILIGGIAVCILFFTLGTVFIVKKLAGGKEEPVQPFALASHLELSQTLPLLMICMIWVII